FEAMQAKRAGANPDQLATLLRTSLAAASRDVDRFTALYQLAILPASNLETELAALRGSDELLGDIAQAAWDTARGRFDDAKARLRPHVDSSIEAAEELGKTYRREGDDHGAADVYRRAASRQHAPHLLVEDADAAADFG